MYTLGVLIHITYNSTYHYLLKLHHIITLNIRIYDKLIFDIIVTYRMLDS